VALAVVAHALDRIRSPVLRALLSRSSWLRDIARSREHRITAIGLASLCIALVLSVGFTASLFLWAPLVLGTSHIVADLRYLLLDPYRPAPLRIRDASVAILLISCIVWQEPLLGWLAVLVTQVLSPLREHSLQRWILRASGISIVGIICFCSYLFPVVSSYILLHAHNAIAIIFFAAVFHRRGVEPSSFAARWSIPLAIGVAGSMIMAGAFDIALKNIPAASVAQYVLPEAAIDTLPPIACARIVALFVFMQSMHYTIWLRLIPELTRPRAGMRSFDSSLRALRHDLGAVVVVATVAITVTFLLIGAVNTGIARDWYLRLAGFHAYLEIAVLIRWMRL
jgi:hypothetical protein